MNIKSFIKNERQIWHDRFVPSFVVAASVAVLTLFLESGIGCAMRDV
jgi:hypothetical protein